MIDIYALKLTRKQVQKYNIINIQIDYKPLLGTINKGSEFENSGNKIN
jgi:hypothetical protein